MLLIDEERSHTLSSPATDTTKRESSVKTAKVAYQLAIAKTGCFKDYFIVIKGLCGDM